MPIPYRIERTVELAQPPDQVWDALTSADGLGGWFGERRRIRHRVKAGPMTIAQAYLAALARDWDSKLARLQRSLDERATPSFPP